MTARVLVVDDEPDVEALVRQKFRREVREGGLYTLDSALSALSALAILDDAGGEKPVFMISAYGDADTVTTALTRGSDEFLTKPVDFPKLKQGIIAVMAHATGRNE